MLRYGGVKFLIAGLLVMAFGGAILGANRAERATEVGSQLVEAATILPENEGKLVMVTGTPELADGGIIADEEAGLTVENALSYSRVPYQLVYARMSREVVVDYGEDKVSDVDDVTETEHYVGKKWIVANQRRDEVLTDFPNSYQNPPPVNLDAYYGHGDLRLNGFKISRTDILAYLQTVQHAFTPEELVEACGEYITRSELNLQATTTQYGNGMLSTGNDIGDVQVLFGYETLENAKPATVIARQRGDELVLEEDDLVSSREQVWAGTVSKEEFLEDISAEDASSRNIGIGALVLGAVLMLLSLDWFSLIGSKK